MDSRFKLVDKVNKDEIIKSFRVKAEDGTDLRKVSKTDLNQTFNNAVSQKKEN